MSDSANFSKLAKLMKADWDRRVSHDYRFWMSDGHRDDAAMWESGKRDLALIFEGIGATNDKVLLEVGCGVGRLLKAALGSFKKVIGFDVSSSAIEKARELLGGDPALELHVGNGYDLVPLADNSIDLAFSYAAITSIPTEVIANYLREIHRVLKPGAVARLQIYLGEEQIVGKDDTLHLRCYRRENFTKAAASAGFAIDVITELRLPFQVSFKEIGIEAVIVSLRKEEREPASAEEIARTLLPQGDEQWSEEKAREVEYWMSLNYAKELVERGDIDRARTTLEYAAAHAQSTSIDVSDLLGRIVGEIEKREKKIAAQPARPSADSALYRANFEVVQRRFPDAARQLASFVDAAKSQHAVSQHTVGQCGDGAVLYIDGQCLDHPDKPKASAQAWAKRLLLEKRFERARRIVVFGFGGGYHVESLLELGGRATAAIEPSIKTFKIAMESRDLRACLERLDNLVIGEAEQLDFLDEHTELAVRPQAQLVHPDYCSTVKALFYGSRGLGLLHPKIAVLGPLQGGTLPIAGYTHRGLGALRQRVRELDVSGFAAGFHQMEKFAVDPTRQAVMQGTYLEMVSQVILESVNEKPIDILICMAQAPISGRVLQELRRRGIITVLWFVEDFLRFTYWKNVAQYYDFVFTIQRGECLSAIKAAGAGEVHYLPTGCDPVVHAPQTLTAEERARWGSPISFVGAGYHNRQQMFASFADMPFKIWGTEWPECKPFDKMVQEKGRRLSPEEYIKIFNSTDININLHSSSERDGVDPFGDFLNPRTFELAASGAFQLVDERTLLPESFEAGKEVITFRNLPDLKEKIAYYLAHPEERAKVVQAARERVLKEHTYAHRLRSMLSIIYSSRFEKLKAREEASPWKKMIERAKPHPELLKRCEVAFERGEEPILDGLISDIVNGNGKLSETEQKLLFLFHIRKQILRMKREEAGG